MSLRNTGRPYYPPPISLRDLAETLGVSALRTIAMRLPGAVVAGPKRNELWRFVVGDCTVIGYGSSVVVAGIDAVQMRQLAARIRLAAQPTGDQTEEAHNAAEVALTFINHQIGQRWRGQVDAEYLGDLLAQWSALDPTAEALAYRELAGLCTDIPTQKWFCNTVQALVRAYTLGIMAGLDRSALAEAVGSEAVWPSI